VRINDLIVNVEELCFKLQVKELWRDNKVDGQSNMVSAVLW